jgi:hypothetical protein
MTIRIKEFLYHLLYAFNIFALVMLFVGEFLKINNYSDEIQFTFINFRLGITIIVMIFWIWNIVIWFKRDKKVGRFFALFFLNGFYTLYYYRLVIKNNWIKNQE